MRDRRAAILHHVSFNGPKNHMIETTRGIPWSSISHLVIHDIFTYWAPSRIKLKELVRLYIIKKSLFTCTGELLRSKDDIIISSFPFITNPSTEIEFT